MSEPENYTGTCDLCGKEADAAVQDCMNIVCTKGCNRAGGDLYHQDCIKKYIGTASRGNIGRMPKIPHSNFGCPKGKSNKTSATEPCKGLALHCKRVHYKTDSKPEPPPQLADPVIERRKAKREKATNLVMEPSKSTSDGAGWEKVERKKIPKPQTSAVISAPLTHRHDLVARLPPIPHVPKPDPLGRNLCKDKPQELPVGFVPPDQGGGNKGKAAKKNQKRAAKRRESALPNNIGDAELPRESWTNGYGVVAASSAAGSDAGGSDNTSLMGSSKFITDIDAYHRLLAGQLSDTAMDSDCDEEEIELTSEELLEASTTTPDFIINEAPLVLPMPLPSQDDGDSPADWQYVLPRGKSTGSSQPSQESKVAVLASNGCAPKENEQSAVVLSSSLCPVAEAASVDDQDFEHQLARALAESQRVEQERIERERVEELALLAQYEGNVQCHQGLNTTHLAHEAHGYSITPIVSYNQAPVTCAPLVTWPMASNPSLVAHTEPSQSSTSTTPMVQANTQQVATTSTFINLPPSVLDVAQGTTPSYMGRSQQTSTPSSLRLWPEDHSMHVQSQVHGVARQPTSMGQTNGANTVGGINMVDEDDDTDELLALLAVA